MDEEYLAHHGIKGQKWGVEHGPPYPVRRGSGGKPKTTSIVKSKLKATLDKRAEAKRAKKADQEKRFEEAKERKAQKAAEKHAEDFERLKKDVVKDPKSLYKNKDKFTRKEIEDLIKEIEFDRKIKDVQNQEITRGLDSYERFKRGLDITANVLGDAKKIYNFAAGVHNVAVDSGKLNGNKWFTIGDDDSKKSKGSDDNNSNKSESSGGSKKKSNNSGKKADTSVKMSDPKVEKAAAKGIKATQWVTKQVGPTPMSKIDRAFQYMYFEGPMSYYSG